MATVGDGDGRCSKFTPSWNIRAVRRFSVQTALLEMAAFCLENPFALFNQRDVVRLRKQYP